MAPRKQAPLDGAQERATAAKSRNPVRKPALQANPAAEQANSAACRRIFFDSASSTDLTERWHGACEPFFPVHEPA